MTSVGSLGQLQKLDNTMDAARKRIAELEAALADDRALAAARAAADAGTARAAGARKALRAREDETRQLEGKMKELEGRLYGGRVHNPKELENLDHELTMFRHHHERLDEATLALMEALEAAEAEEQSAREALSRAAAERADGTRAWSEESRALGTQLADASSEIQETRRGLPDEVLEAYDRLRRRMPLAAVPVRHGLCGGCGIGVPEAVAAQARDGQTAARCDNCGRILYVE